MLPRFLLVVAPILAHTAVVAQGPRALDFERAFQWLRPIQLAQTSQVLNVSPRVKQDPRGGLLVIDPPEGQVRLYETNGRLKAHFGRRGQGPGEFRSLASVVRAQSGVLWTIDGNGRLTVWSEDGKSRIDDFTIPLRNITDAELVGNDSLLLITPPHVTRASPSGPILHLVDLKDRKLIRSFYEPAIPPGGKVVWGMLEGGSISVSGDAIGVTSPLLDSLLILSRSGLSKIAAKPLDFLTRNKEIPDPRVNRPGFLTWVRESSWIGLMQGNETGWLIPRSGYGEHTVNDLLFFPNAGGEPILIRNGPPLVGIASNGEFVFANSAEMEPQHLRTARFRSVDR